MVFVVEGSHSTRVPRVQQEALSVSLLLLLLAGRLVLMGQA